jgi:hypothetical protein
VPPVVAAGVEPPAAAGKKKRKSDSAGGAGRRSKALKNTSEAAVALISLPVKPAVGSRTPKIWGGTDYWCHCGKYHPAQFDGDDMSHCVICLIAVVRRACLPSHWFCYHCHPEQEEQPPTPPPPPPPPPLPPVAVVVAVAVAVAVVTHATLPVPARPGPSVRKPRKYPDTLYPCHCGREDHTEMFPGVEMFHCRKCAKCFIHNSCFAHTSCNVCVHCKNI